MGSKRSGVYMIQQLSTRRVYIGSSSDLTKRKQEHWTALSDGRHGNAALQAAWDATGEADFIFHVHEEIADRGERLKREEYWLRRISPHNKFNVIEVADVHKGGHQYCVTDEAQDRIDARVENREMCREWAEIEIVEEWKSAGKPLRDTIDPSRNHQIQIELKRAIEARAKEVADRHGLTLRG
jgi:group I intron endonuclease